MAQFMNLQLLKDFLELASAVLVMRVDSWNSRNCWPTCYQKNSDIYQERLIMPVKVNFNLRVDSLFVNRFPNLKI